MWTRNLFYLEKHEVGNGTECSDSHSYNFRTHISRALKPSIPFGSFIYWSYNSIHNFFSDSPLALVSWRLSKLNTHDLSQRHNTDPVSSRKTSRCTCQYSRGRVWRCYNNTIPWVPQYFHTFHLLNEIYFYKRVGKFVHPIHTSNIKLLKFKSMGYINNKRTTDVSRDNNFNTRRFKTIICFLQLGGIPVHVVSISNANTLYNTLCVVCFYCAFMCALMDTFVHRYDLKEAMKKSRICFGISFVAWTHFSLRYENTIIISWIYLFRAFVLN
jgi:hypothetical protein